MADVNVKMGVSGISQFKQGMNDASASVKTFDAALKSNERQLKATGNAENYMQAQTQLLNGKLEAQRNIVKNAEQALKQMEQNGVKTTSAAYQNMQRRLIEAQSGMMDTEQALNNLGNTAGDAAGKTDKLQDSLGGLNKKVSLEQVISGIDSITGAMEKAAKKAVDLGKMIWENITDAARWSDDINTKAAILGMDVEDYQAYKDVFDTFADITVQEWMKAKTKVQKAMLDPTNDQLDALTALGLAPMQGGKGSQTVEEVAGNWEEMLWDIGQALRDKVASGEMDMDLADVYANAIFGKSFASLNPLFNMGKEAFYEAVEKQTVASKEAIEANAELNDTLFRLQGDFEQLKSELTGGLAPALSKAADAISDLLGNIMAYLKTPEGKQALKDLETAVTGLFDDLGKIDPDDVVSGFTDVFNTVVDSVQWMVDNKGTIENSLKAIFGVWAGLEVSSGVLTIVNLINGLNTLTGAGAAATTAGEAVGASWGSGFASAVLKAAPWLLFLYETLKPNTNTHDKLGNNELFDENGNLTKEGKAAGMTQEDQAEYNQRQAQIQAVRELTGLSDQQRNALQGFWSVWKDVMDQRAEGREVQQHTMDAYNLYGQQLQTLFDGQEVQLNKYMEKMKELYAGGEKGNLLDLTFFNIDKDGLEIMVQLEAPEDAAEQLAEEVGTVEINGVIHFVDADGNNVGVTSDFFGQGTPTGKKRTPQRALPGHANGIWSVPFDGYEAVLHKGERVIPAREVGSSRNFSSNLYIESMYMNNGTDAEGLAAAIAAANRRTMRGYGS